MTARELLRDVAMQIECNCRSACSCPNRLTAAALRVLADRLDAEMANADEVYGHGRYTIAGELYNLLARLDADLSPTPSLSATASEDPANYHTAAEVGTAHTRTAPLVATPWCRICPHPEHDGPCDAFDVAFQPDNRCPCVTR